MGKASHIVSPFYLTQGGTNCIDSKLVKSELLCRIAATMMQMKFDETADSATTLVFKVGYWNTIQPGCSILHDEGVGKVQAAYYNQNLWTDTTSSQPSICSGLDVELKIHHNQNKCPEGLEIPTSSLCQSAYESFNSHGSWSNDLRPRDDIPFGCLLQIGADGRFVTGNLFNPKENTWDGTMYSGWHPVCINVKVEASEFPAVDQVADSSKAPQTVQHNQMTLACCKKLAYCWGVGYGMDGIGMSDKELSTAAGYSEQ